LKRDRTKRSWDRERTGRPGEGRGRSGRGGRDFESGAPGQALIRDKATEREHRHGGEFQRGGQEKKIRLAT